MLELWYHNDEWHSFGLDEDYPGVGTAASVQDMRRAIGNAVEKIPNPGPPHGQAIVEHEVDVLIRHRYRYLPNPRVAIEEGQLVEHTSSTAKESRTG